MKYNLEGGFIIKEIFLYGRESEYDPEPASTHSCCALIIEDTVYCATFSDENNPEVKGMPVRDSVRKFLAQNNTLRYTEVNTTMLAQLYYEN